MKGFLRQASQRARQVGCLWVLGGGILGLVVLVASLTLLPWIARPEEPTQLKPALTVIAFPTATPTPTTTLTPTVPPEPTATVTAPPAAGDLRLGGLVEIKGTEGDGLRLREQPNLGANIRFVALESEVFELQDGPRQQDGYAWWFLVNPYDTSKRGWGVSNYLRSADGE